MSTTPRPHTHREIATALVGGFAASFLTFTVTTYTTNSGMRGQLMAGDPAVNQELPTTLNMMQSAMDGNNSMLNSMGSYTWWILVIIVGLIGAFVLLKVMRRYV
jgi:hypothetical protein